MRVTPLCLTCKMRVHRLRRLFSPSMQDFSSIEIVCFWDVVKLGVSPLLATLLHPRTQGFSHPEWFVPSYALLVRAFCLKHRVRPQSEYLSLSFHYFRGSHLVLAFFVPFSRPYIPSCVSDASGPPVWDGLYNEYLEFLVPTSTYHCP